MAQRSRLAAGVVAAMAASGIGSARASVATDQRVALIWNAPAGCPTSQVISNDIEKSLAGSLKDVAPVAAAVNVVAPEPSFSLGNARWRANLVVHSHGKRAQRQFEAESCEALASAAALIISLAAEGTDDGPPTRSAVATQPPEFRPDPPAARPAGAIAAAPTPGPAQPAAGWIGSAQHLALGGVIDSGTMPSSPAGGIEAAAEQMWISAIWRLRVSAGATFFFPQNLPQQDLFGVPFGRYWAVTFSGRGCFTAAVSRFEIGPCVGAEMVVMHGTDVGQPLDSDTQYWASPLGSAVMALTLAQRVVVFARTDVVVPTTRRSFMGGGGTSGLYDVYKVPSYALRGAIGLELRIF